MVTEADIHYLEQKVRNLEEKYDKLIDKLKDWMDHTAGVGDIVILSKPHMCGDAYETHKYLVEAITKR